MCFSASASLTASAFLVPTGIYCIRMALDRDRDYLSISCLPLAFGIQQGIEGLLWLGFEAQNSNEILLYALGFLFFSHFFWLAWIPFSALAVEPHPLKKKILFGLTALGTLYGALLYIPLLLNPGWLNVRVINGSIDYQLELIFSDFFPSHLMVWLYIFFILCPLFLSSVRSITRLGGLIAISAFFTYFSFSHAFISVWCFFAAVISAYIFYILQRECDSMSDYKF
jgi:heme A synthase